MSVQQLEALMEYLESQQELALGRTDEVPVLNLGFIEMENLQALCLYRQRLQALPVPTEPASSQATQQPEQAAPRRRRRRRRQEMDAEPEEQSTLRTATDMLQNIEVASANATNRLAAAIETLAARLSEPIRIVLEQPASTHTRQRPQRVHRRNRRIIIDSDSD
ncbi:uncharacterized protein LOC124641463 [Helicoverpa zea]|uniref:uncharacterized protein LOC124641463 n=1 Tax=Helicoverpa zea TaxID=7113 RepID=UPI001F57FD34|nr:uncharacterized protein LOC124641463 [Helicoverpa zea]